jgi:hypothetical protein
MKWVTLVMMFVLAGSARAGEPCEKWWSVLYPANRCCPKRPDDYCRKPPPCPAPWRYCGPDDYCRKPLPCAAPWRYCSPDAYCPKPFTFQVPPCLPQR